MIRSSSVSSGIVLSGGLFVPANAQTNYLAPVTPPQANAPELGDQPGVRKNLPALTGVRIFAACMIVLLHSGDTFGINNSHILSKVELIQGVSLFFVLSGFILTYTYSNLARPKEAVRFVLLRLARIWPVHAVTALFAAIFLSHKWLGHAYILLPNFFLIQDWIPVERFFFSLNAVSWSVSAELFFYVCFPILNLLIKRFPALSLCFSFLLASAFVFASGRYPGPIGHLDQVTSFGLSYVNPVVRLFEFAVGIATARFYLNHSFMLQQHWKRRYVVALELTCIALLFIALVGTKQIISVQTMESVTPNLSTWVQTSGGVIAYAALIFMLACERGLLFKFLSQRSLVWLGEISYSVYLVHWLWIKVFVQLHYTQLHLPRTLCFGLYCALVFGTAALLYTFVEKPARKALAGRIHHLVRA